jgi:hypothetical protein
MLSIVIALLAGILFFWLMMRRRGRMSPGSWDARHAFGPVRLGLCAAFIIALSFGVMVLASLVYTEISDEEKAVEAGRSVHQIATLQDTTATGGEIRGSFFLGIGSVAGAFGPQIGYSWYQREGNVLRGVVVSEDGYNEVVVHEGDYRPHVLRRWWTDPCHTPWWLNPIHQLCGTGDWQESWDIFVPEGTVIRNLRLDAR